MALLYIVGTGPGTVDHLTGAAVRAIADSDVIIGYDSYVELVRSLLDGKNIVSTGMMQEVQRCREALRLAREGATVALVSGGDSGIYGMAGLVLELVEEDRCDSPDLPHVDIRVIPGVSAVQAAASQLGAPLMHDFAVISLSDLLTPWGVITTRLEAAARADFVIAIYNPRSRSRTTQIVEAQRIILAHRPPDTPAGIVRNACRDGQEVIVTTLADLLEHEIDMTSVVLVGNASSYIDGAGRMVTPRGYAAKYGRSRVGDSPASGERSAQVRPGAVMFCGTASDVGKSIVTAGFCRCLVRHGVSVAPFKSQNMSLNSCVTPEGGEIGRAQGVQAQACGIPPHTDMNPVLLKPNSDTGSQIIVQGKAVGSMVIGEYDAYKPAAFEKVRESFGRLQARYGFIAIEGAGSISEINLKQNDIANLKVAAMAGCPVILVADIDRGGVFAQILGTLDLLEPWERASVKGIIINKFRGDLDILKPGLEFIEQRTGVPVLGVLPWRGDIRLPAEDSVALDRHMRQTADDDRADVIRIGVLRLPRISNFTDFDPLLAEPDVRLRYIDRPEQLAGVDVLIIPGSKSTIPDLNVLKENGLFTAVRSFGGRIVGICGGLQMLGRSVCDPDGMESGVSEAEGLALLPAATVLLSHKETHLARAVLCDAGQKLVPECPTELSGYEIHMGLTTLEPDGQPFARIYARGADNAAVDDGAVSSDGRVFGTYLHGIFDNDAFRDGYLNVLRREKGLQTGVKRADSSAIDPFEQLADLMEENLDMPKLLDICGLAGADA